MTIPSEPNRERVSRPPLERTAPRRSWSGIFGAGQQDAAGSGEPAGHARPRAPGESVSELVSRSVELGYRVVDEYIRQGQLAAQQLEPRAFAADASGGLRRLSEQWAQGLSEMARIGLEFVGLAAQARSERRAPPPFDTRSGPEAPRTAAAPPPEDAASVPDEPGESRALHIAFGASALVLEVDGRRLACTLESGGARLRLELQADALERELVLHDLRALGPDALPRLGELRWQPAQGGAAARLEIRVPADQPDGDYSGVVVDPESGLPVGTIGVRVRSGS